MRSWSIALILIVISAGMLLSNVDVVSIFKGSHYVTDVSRSDNDVNCTACHKSVAKEMEITRTLGGPHSDLSCESCHRFNNSTVTQFAVANESGAFPGKEAHAAYVPRCLDCHGGNGVLITNRFGQTVYAPPARAFNQTPIPNYTAHKQLFEYCKQLGDENLACLACHSNYSVNLSFKYHYSLSYVLSNWNFTSFTPNGIRVYSVNVSKQSKFSGKHVFLPLNKINCSKCHENIYLGLINGIHAPIYWYLSWKKSNWTAYNLWDDRRYHGIGIYDSSTGDYIINTSWINNTYCAQCHYNLNVNSTAAYNGLVHCAEKVSCLTCHGTGKPYDPYDVIGTGNQSSNKIGHRQLLNELNEVNNNYPRMYHADVCMGCHKASIHATVSCGWCHNKGSVSVDVYSEPDGRVYVW